MGLTFCRLVIVSCARGIFQHPKANCCIYIWSISHTYDSLAWSEYDSYVQGWNQKCFNWTWKI